MKTLYGIQYLRASAATAVVVFHAAERTGLHFNIGAAGVDVFFVVSGFIMMVISARRPVKPLSFLRDRLLRIAPSYWLVTMIMIAGAAVGLFPNLIIEPLHAVGSFLFIPVPSPNGGHLWPVLVQGWTLNYEIFFYLVFAAVLFAPARQQLPLLTGSLLLLVAVGSFAADPSPLVRFYTNPLVLEFAAGACLAQLWLKGMLPPKVIGLTMIVIAIGGFAAIEILRLGFDAWSCGPLAALLLVGVLSLEKEGWLPSLPILTYLGDASYSIYLWHTLALAVVVKAGLHLGVPPVVIAAAGTFAGVFVGVVAYEMVEKPIQRFVKRRRLPVTPVVSGQPAP
jgi:Predicted acyltransferases